MPSSHDPQQVIRHLVGLYPEWRQIVGWKPNACVAAGRVGTEVLAYFGVAAVPVPVATRVKNPMMVQLEAEGAILTDENLEELGGYYLGTDPDSKAKPIAGPAWNCHLTLWTPGQNVLVDLTLEQYNRPKHGIVLTSMGAVVTDENAGPFLAGTDWAVIRHSSGVEINYKHRPDQTGYRTTSDWKRTKYKKEIGTLIRVVRASMDREARQAADA